MLGHQTEKRYCIQIMIRTTFVTIVPYLANLVLIRTHCSQTTTNFKTLAHYLNKPFNPNKIWLVIFYRQKLIWLHFNDSYAEVFEKQSKFTSHNLRPVRVPLCARFSPARVESVQLDTAMLIRKRRDINWIILKTNHFSIDLTITFE